MALGTLTLVSAAVRGPSDPVFTDVVTVVGDNSYPTGGSTGMLAKIRAAMKDQREILTVIDAAAPGGRRCAYDQANEKLMVFGTTGAEIAATTDLSAVTFRLVVLSK